MYCWGCGIRPPWLEARKLLLRLADKRLGQPSARMQAALARIDDLSRLEAMIERLEKVQSWNALLAEVRPN